MPLSCEKANEPILDDGAPLIGAQIIIFENKSLGLKARGGSIKVGDLSRGVSIKEAKRWSQFHIVLLLGGMNELSNMWV